MEDIIKELFEETRNGKVTIECLNDDKWTFNVKCFLNVNEIQNEEDEETPVVHINNMNEFKRVFNEYVKYASEFYKEDKDYYDLSNKGFYKKLLLDLLASASVTDLYDFEKYVYKKTLMIKDDLIKEINTEVGKYLDYNINLNISKTMSNLEAPYKAKFIFKGVDGNFTLPSITFGVIRNKAYIMAIQFKGDVKANSTSKKLDRYFRKVNKDVDESTDIANVSPNALVALTLFNSYLKQIGVKEVEATCFMPIRYNTNKINYMRKTKIESDEYDHIQFNITNKFMNLFNRYAYHFNNDVEFDNYDIMHLELNDKKINRDNIIYELDKCMKSNNKI